MNRTCRVGVHGRNDYHFHDADYVILRDSKIEAVKMMSQTHVDHFKRISEIPNIEIITRLYDDRFGKQGHPSPEQFAERMVPVMKRLQPYCVKFEIHNEPNHLDRIEGWGDTDDDARNFNAWYLRTFDILKSQCPWAKLGFPGLAIPHRDLEWVEICRSAVEKSDWLGVHCYWQTPQGQLHNHLADFWGLRFKYYHDRFPDKIIDLTEVGNSNVQNNIPFTRESHAREFTEYLTECFKYPYLNSASFFIMSSPDRNWDGFCWRNESGEIYPITRAVRDMHRPFWTLAHVASLTPATPPPADTETQPPADDTAQDQQELQMQAQLQQAQQQALARFAQLDDQITQLQAQNGQLQSQIEQLQSQVAQLFTLMQQLQAQLASGSTAPAEPPVSSPTPPVTAQPAPVIQNIMSQLKRNPQVSLPSRPLSQIDRIIIHHTAVAPNVGAEQIAAYLVDNRGRPGISYHYFITADGIAQQTNDIGTVTGQSTVQLNAVAVGVGFAGNFTDTVPTPVQIEGGARLIAWLLQQLNLSPQAVIGHKELINTQSPGAQWDAGAQWGTQLRQKIQAFLTGTS